MRLLKSPGKGSMCRGSSRGHKVPTLGSAHRACSPSLLAVTQGKLFALLLFLLSLFKSRAVGGAAELTLRSPHSGHRQSSATGLAITLGGSCLDAHWPDKMSCAG